MRPVWFDVKRFDPLSEPGPAGEDNPVYLEAAISRVTGASPTQMSDMALSLYGYAIRAESAVTLGHEHARLSEP